MFEFFLGFLRVYCRMNGLEDGVVYKREYFEIYINVLKR